MTKHELLEVLSLDKELTITEILPQAGCSYIALYLLFKRATEQGLIQVIAKNKKQKIYNLTPKGKHRLEYFDAVGCSSKGCLICNR
ncbi:MAG: hypothetical protein AB1478_09065 [Nitrospirota bacterium]